MYEVLSQITPVERKKLVNDGKKDQFFFFLLSRTAERQSTKTHGDTETGYYIYNKVAAEECKESIRQRSFEK